MCSRERVLAYLVSHSPPPPLLYLLQPTDLSHVRALFAAGGASTVNFAVLTAAILDRPILIDRAALTPGETSPLTFPAGAATSPTAGVPGLRLRRRRGRPRRGGDEGDSRGVGGAANGEADERASEAEEVEEGEERMDEEVGTELAETEAAAAKSTGMQEATTMAGERALPAAEVIPAQSAQPVPLPLPPPPSTMIPPPVQEGTLADAAADVGAPAPSAISAGSSPVLPVTSPVPGDVSSGGGELPAPEETLPPRARAAARDSLTARRTGALARALQTPARGEVLVGQKRVVCALCVRVGALAGMREEEGSGKRREEGLPYSRYPGPLLYPWGHSPLCIPPSSLPLRCFAAQPGPFSLFVQCEGAPVPKAVPAATTTAAAAAAVPSTTTPTRRGRPRKDAASRAVGAAPFAPAPVGTLPPVPAGAAAAPAPAVSAVPTQVSPQMMMMMSYYGYYPGSYATAMPAAGFVMPAMSLPPQPFPMPPAGLPPLPGPAAFAPSPPLSVAPAPPIPLPAQPAPGAITPGMVPQLPPPQPTSPPPPFTGAGGALPSAPGVRHPAIAPPGSPPTQLQQAPPPPPPQPTQPALYPSQPMLPGWGYRWPMRPFLCASYSSRAMWKSKEGVSGG